MKRPHPMTPGWPRKIIAGVVMVSTASFLMISCRGSQGQVGSHSPKDTDSCGSACAHFRRLGCKAGDDVPCTPNDPDCLGQPKVSCEAFCRITQQRGVWLNPACEFLSVAEPTDVTPPLCPEVEDRCAAR